MKRPWNAGVKRKLAGTICLNCKHWHGRPDYPDYSDEARCDIVAENIETSPLPPLTWAEQTCHNFEKHEPESEEADFDEYDDGKITSATFGDWDEDDGFEPDWHEHECSGATNVAPEQATLTQAERAFVTGTRALFARADWFVNTRRVPGRKRKPYLHLLCNNDFGTAHKRVGLTFAVLCRGVDMNLSLSGLYSNEGPMPHQERLVRAPETIRALLAIIDRLSPAGSEIAQSPKIDQSSLGDPRQEAPR